MGWDTLPFVMTCVGDDNAKVSSCEKQCESACCASNAKVNTIQTCDEGYVEVSCSEIHCTMS